MSPAPFLADYSATKQASLFLLCFIFLTWGPGRRVRLWGLPGEGSGVAIEQAPSF